MAGTCTETGCERDARGRGLCITHYAFRSRHGTLPELIRPVGCKVDGCTRRHEAHGWCQLHYQRWKKTGSVEDPVRTASDSDRFWAKVDRSGGPEACWPWTGSLIATYGTFWVDGRSVPAHRVAYELIHGPIPAGLHIDHTCHTNSTDCPGGKQCPHRLCQNPAHLEAVTKAENNRRAALVLTDEGRAKRRTSGKLGAIARWGTNHEGEQS